MQADGQEMSTTLAFGRMLTDLLRDKQLGPPIVADEARTFDLANRTSSSPPLASSQPKNRIDAISCNQAIQSFVLSAESRAPWLALAPSCEAPLKPAAASSGV
jgi:hypothetical protein